MASYEPERTRGCVYLIHFDRPICPTSPARHYLGFAYDVAKRLREHRAGKGARLCQVALERGIGFTVVRRWEGGRALERRLKDRHDSPRLCPVCNPHMGEELEF